MIVFFTVIGVATCGGVLMTLILWAAAQIDHWQWMRRLERMKKECPNCGGTGRVQS